MNSPSDRPAWYDAILPVIDLRHGQVVHGIAGRRDEYLPVSSRYVEDSRPGTIAMLYARTFGFQDCYVADLNAICEGQVDAAGLEAIAVQGLNVWLDAGIGNLDQWRACEQSLREWRPYRWVIGLESLESWQSLSELITEIGAERLVFSLDLQNGTLLTSRNDFRDLTPLEVAQRAVQVGVRQQVVLDLAAVGEGGGTGVEPLLQELREQLPEDCLLAGGGMASPADVEALVGLGVGRVLVASALHDGRIAPFHAERRQGQPRLA